MSGFNVIVDDVEYNICLDEQNDCLTIVATFNGIKYEGIVDCEDVEDGTLIKNVADLTESLDVGLDKLMKGKDSNVEIEIKSTKIELTVYENYRSLHDSFTIVLGNDQYDKIIAIKDNLSRKTVRIVALEQENKNIKRNFENLVIIGSVLFMLLFGLILHIQKNIQ